MHGGRRVDRDDNRLPLTRANALATDSNALRAVRDLHVQEARVAPHRRRNFLVSGRDSQMMHWETVGQGDETASTVRSQTARAVEIANGLSPCPGKRATSPPRAI